MKLTLVVLTISVFLIAVPFASEGISQVIPVSGTLLDTNGKDKISDGLIKVSQENRKYELSTTANGNFKLNLDPGQATITYHAPGYRSLKDVIEVKVNGENKFDKKLQKISASGWWTILLLVPGVFGLLVAWLKENIDGNRDTSKTIQDRLLVALVNGVVWAIVLSWIWYNTSYLQGIHQIQFFHRSMSIEFFVPLLGYFGSLLYVFDIFRGKNDDSIKDKEFGMRIIMAPYVAIVMVALFGKEFDVIDLESATGQGTLAFISGLLVVVVIQGMIERANEFLGKWRRKINPYVASPLAEKFKLSEIEDKALGDIALRYPYQLSMWPDDDLFKKLADVEFDEHLALAMKRSIEWDELEAGISDLIWDRLKPINVTTMQDFSTLSNAALQQIAKKKPELSDERLFNLRDKAIALMNTNGDALTS